MKKLAAFTASLLFSVSLLGCGAAPAEPPAEPQPPAVDYAADPAEWSYLPGTGTDPVTQALTAIDTTPYGTAGASLMQVIAGVNFLQLSAREDVLPAVQSYLDGMTPLQLDYFSFQWQQARSAASGILSGFPENQPLLADAGFPDFDPVPYLPEALDTLKETVCRELSLRGVTDVWSTLGADFPCDLP